MAQVLIFEGVAVTMLAVVLLLMPALTPATVPLGVSVPRSRVNHPAVVGAIRRFRLLTAVSWLVGAGVALLCAASVPGLAPAVSAFAFLVLATGSYELARRPIQRAKHAEGWYDDADVRIRGDMVPASVPRPLFAWFIAGVLVVLIAIAWGAFLFPGMPTSIPVHWNAAGEIDRHAAKSVWSMFGVPMLALGLVVLLFLFSIVLQRMPRRDPSAARDQVLRTVLAGRLLGQLALLVALMLCAMTVLDWLKPGLTGWPQQIIPLVGLVAILALVLLALPSLARANRPQRGTPATDDPDTDRYWRGGLVYVNRNNPALLVQKRFGVGWTINFGSPAGIGIGVLLLAVVAAGIVLPIVTSGR
jgi:uncharacterized membrane protein